ncbi:gonadotropin-releasing hormone receptor-like [Liolophura sinensis]|uniref:gonadotropin-releasing hormone receptor-like n=1 Tax=Liolophura sinensis TaxID=3198878 RepID=UPI0031582C8D
MIIPNVFANRSGLLHSGLAASFHLNFTEPCQTTGTFLRFRGNNLSCEEDGGNMSVELFLDRKDAEVNAPTFDEVVMVKTVVLATMFVISFIGNVATVVQMFRVKRRSTINKLKLQLAAADLIVTFFCILVEAIWASTVQWKAGNAMCKIVKYMQIFGLYLSTYITVIISLDRCCAILDPMSRTKSPRRVRMMIIVSWVLSAFFSLPQAVIFHVKRGPFKQEFYQCVTHGSYTHHWQEQLYSALSLLFMFIIPLTIMVVSYGLIFCTIARKSRNYNDADVSPISDMLRGHVRSQLLRKAKKKSLRITFVIVLAFIVCWTPYYVIFIGFTYFNLRKIDPRIFLCFFFVGMSNSMLNPLIYGAFHICKVHNSRLVREAILLEFVSMYYDNVKL